MGTTGKAFRALVDAEMKKIEKDRSEASKIRETAKRDFTWPTEKKPAADKMWERSEKKDKANTQFWDERKKVRDQQKQQQEQQKKQAQDQRQKALQQTKAQAEKALKDFVDNAEFDWTDANARKAYDEQKKQLQAGVDSAGSEIANMENQKVMDADMEQINAMPEKDREQLRQYISGKEGITDVFGQSNPFRWLTENKKLSDSAKYLEEKYGKDRAKQLASSYDRYLKEEQARQTEAETRESVNKGTMSAVGQNVLGVGTRLAGGVQATVDRAMEALDGDDRYTTLKPTTRGDIVSLHGNTVTEQTAQNIAGDEYDENGNLVKDGGILRQGAAYLYQGGMSMVDSFARAAAGGGAAGGAAIAASNAFSQTVSDATKQGASPAQAYKLGAAVAGIEYLSEKVPMEETLKVGKDGNTKVIVNALKQAGVEATTEELSLIGDFAAELAILQEKASYNQQIGDLVASGMRYEDAKKEAFKGLLEEAKQTAIVSGLAGAISGGGSAIVGNLRDHGTPIYQNPAKAAQADAQAVQDVQVTQTPTPVETAVQETQTAPVVNPQEQTQTAADTLLDGVVDQTPPPPAKTEGQALLDDMAARTLGLEPEQQAQETEVKQPEALPRKWEDATGKAPAAEFDQRMQDQMSMSDEDFLNSMGDNAPTADNPMADRNWNDVGKRNVKAYMYENPAVKPFFQMEAQNMLTELKDSTRGERGYNDQVYYDSGGEKGFYGVKRHTSESIADLLDNGFTYDQIEKGLNAIIEDHGAENNAASKRIEFLLNDRLLNGYNSFYDSGRVPASEDYINLVNSRSAPSVDTSGTSAEGGQIDHGAVGAAEENFSGKPAYNATLSEDNAQADRRDDVRPMELPKQDINGGDVSAVTGNVYGSKITPDAFASLMEEPTAKGDFTYAKISNDQATQMATETIAKAGTWENAYDSWKQSVAAGNAGAEMSARGAVLLNYAAQKGDKAQWLETLHYMQKLGTNTAQGLQAMRIIRTLKPTDKVEFTKMSVGKIVADFKSNQGIDIEVDPDLMTELTKATTEEARDVAISNIQQNIADQIPSTALDKFTALRYTNMLGNLKTNVRNIAGNVGAAAAYKVKDTIATGMEAIASKVSGGKIDRTKSLFVSGDLLKACKEDFNQFRETVSDGGKYGDRMSADNQFMQGVQDKRRIFKTNFKNETARKIGDAVLTPMELYRKGTNWAMNNEYFGDEAFGKAAYSRALAGYLQANGVTGSDLSEVDGALLDKARAYAIKEAQEATFHDNSALAQIVSKVQKDTGVVGQGIMPFTKTPANVLTRAEEFSPLGLINSTVMSLQKAASGTNLTNGTGVVGKWARSGAEITGADIVNSWAKSITGVGLFALGAAMYDQGLLTGGPDEDEEKAAFDELNGQQNYAIQLPDGTNYTIDWLTPAAMPMFMGAQFWKLFSDDRDLTFADMEQVFTSIADPMIQMSMLQGLNDSLDGIKYSDNNIGQFFINAAVSYLTQGLSNTLLGQIERSTEENRQTTYIDKDSNVPVWLQRTLGQLSQKVPGWDYQQMDYRNAWGQTEKNEGGLLYNLLSPGYLSKEQSDRVTEELYRIHDATGENVFPQTAPRTVTYTDTSGTVHKDHNLTQKELETFQKVEGETAAKLMAEAIGSEDFAALTDDQKAEVMHNINTYAQEQAKQAALSGYHSKAPAWMDDVFGGGSGEIVKKTVNAGFSGALEDLNEARKAGWDTAKPMEALDSAYQTYTSMGDKSKGEFLESCDSTVKTFITAKEKGVDTGTFANLYGEYKRIVDTDATSGDKALEWSNTLEKAVEDGTITKKQRDVFKDSMAFRYTMTAKTQKYDEMTENGISPDKAYSVEKLLDGITPLPGNKTVSDSQKWGAIAGMNGLSDSDKDTAIKSYMTDYDPNAKSLVKTELKYDYARQELGLSPEQYVEAYKVSLSGKKAEKIAEWESMGYSPETAKALYRLFNASGKTKINVVEWHEGQSGGSTSGTESGYKTDEAYAEYLMQAWDQAQKNAGE